LLSGVKITDMASLKSAIQALHERYHIPHIVITSVNLPDQPAGHLSVVGSSMTSNFKPRLFQIVFPAIDCYFSGTGDMFGALITVRMRQAVFGKASAPSELQQKRSWLSDDDTAVLDLPLVHAVEMVLASMHEVLTKTAEGMAVASKAVDGAKTGAVDEKAAHLARSKSAELKLVRNLASLREPVVEYKAKKI
jgi:pyridoxine kinase